MKGYDIYAGDSVFVEGCPWIKMEVCYTGSEFCTCRWYNKFGELEIESFPMDVLVLYAYAGLVRVGKWNFCLN